MKSQYLDKPTLLDITLRERTIFGQLQQLKSVTSSYYRQHLTMWPNQQPTAKKALCITYWHIARSTRSNLVSETKRENVSLFDKGRKGEFSWVSSSKVGYMRTFQRLPEPCTWLQLCAVSELVDSLSSSTDQGTPKRIWNCVLDSDILRSYQGTLCGSRSTRMKRGNLGVCCQKW